MLQLVGIEIFQAVQFIDSPFDDVKSLRHCIHQFAFKTLGFLSHLLKCIRSLTSFAETYADLYGQPRASLYHSYTIPKRSGGRRQIDEPQPPLMNALRNLKSMLEINFSVLHHTSAFAYVKGRSTVDAVRRHQSNNSRWFLKTDFSNFFGSTTKEFLMRMLKHIYPFSYVCQVPEGERALDRVIDLCFLNGGLPQGTPVSPTLTNLMMIPIDFAISHQLRSGKYVYTRYADDILISHRESFNHEQMVMTIDEVLRRFGAPFRIKPEKTRYGSSAGRNWNLGVMLTKDNKITVGRKRKEQLKAMCHSYLQARSTGNPWDVSDVQYMQGLMSYYKMVEPEYMQGFITYINSRFQVNLLALIREDLNH